MTGQTDRPRLTLRGERVLRLAQAEARRLHQNQVGPEHVLVGMVREGEGVGATILADLGLDLSCVRAAVESTAVAGAKASADSPELASQTRALVDLAVDEARRRGHHYVSTEHLLLALVLDSENAGAHVLNSLGVRQDDIRDRVISSFDGG
jgi:ATP-dependent Clp protease ATP-binding subunit ClpC